MAEQPLRATTFLGDATMDSIDFFAQTYMELDCAMQEHSAVIKALDHILVVSWLWAMAIVMGSLFSPTTNRNHSSVPTNFT